MTTLMVHLQLAHANTRLLQVAADLAGRLNADMIGIAAAQPLRVTYGGDVYVSGDVIVQDRGGLEKEIEDAETEFRAALRHHGGNLEWRSAVTFPSLADYLANQARCADLLITGVDRGSISDFSRHIDVAGLVMQLGRPALIVPGAGEKLSLERVLIGWKDTRESRRAALDALPLLKKATHVAVCEIASQEEIGAAHDHLADVVGWLKRNGIVAQPIAAVATADDASQLQAIASDQGADVIVAGAYGHSRLREWALGGITRDLLLHSGRCAFVSH